MTDVGTRIAGAEFDAVWAALGAEPRTISSRYFYDLRGSELFEEITRLDEYYPTRAERQLLEQWGPALVRRVAPQSLVELGAGSSEKTRILLRAMAATGGGTYVPLDVSHEFLEASAAELVLDFPALDVRPVVADFTRGVTLPRTLPRPALFAFLGSTLGNFEAAEAALLLRRVRRAMARGDRLLLGVDLRKDPAIIEAAYNDGRGVTEDFNRNALRVLNDRFGTDFEPAHFRHHAFYDRQRHRIEMHLVAERDMVVRAADAEPLRLARGDSIRTEVSCKYDRPAIEDLFRAAGLRLEAWETGSERLFALALGAPA